jgi:myo-inositol-1(or 4)-monophosphatase
MRDFARRGSLRVDEKGTSDFVSSADLASEATLRDALAAAYPAAALVMEESAATAPASAARMRFYVDPLDGTTNFLHGLPHFAVSIAMEEDGEMVAGVVYDPPKDELFWAARGEGAFCGEQRVRTSGAQTLANGVVATGVPHRGRGDHPSYLAALGRVMNEVSGIRRFGAAALDLAYLAAGRFEAFFEKGLAPWDVAAGGLLVREAGGIVTRSDGSPMGLRDADVLASATPAIHASMLALLA